MWANRPVFYYDSTDSTNVRAKCAAAEGAVDGSLFVAEEQTAGRGRRGRIWESPKGCNLYFSLLLRPQIAPERAPMLTPVMAVAVVRGIQRTMAADGLLIKWPNDIVADGKKICGILTELELGSAPGTTGHVVIGVGINVCRQEFAPELADKATTLEAVFGTAPDRHKLLENIMECFEEAYEGFLQCGNLSCLKDTYEALLVNLGREVCVLDPAGQWQGIAKGIDEQGRLLVETPEGDMKAVYAGEVSVRGIYGYV